jgi:hypothetical protein
MSQKDISIENNKTQPEDEHYVELTKDALDLYLDDDEDNFNDMHDHIKASHNTTMYDVGDDE